MDPSDLTELGTCRGPVAATIRRSGVVLGWMLVGCGFIAMAGCNTFSSGKLAKQLQSENERLLAEYRAQKAINEQLQQKNALLENRVAESEKLLAKQYGGSRISSLTSRWGGDQPQSSQLPADPRWPNPASGIPPIDASLKWESR